jgi:polysaccharide deacetylase family protein (PEP-CTERM system associated)
MVNALTVDVEDYFQVTAFENNVKRSDWPSYPLRVERNTRRILAILDEYGVKGTFFVLGWVAERIPGLVRAIHAAGHEIACHGYDHELVYRIGPDKFRDDVRRSKTLLEDIIGDKVHGYRAPSYSITAQSLWALDILVEEGFKYDSSIFPVHHDTYGIPGAQRFPHTLMTAAGPLLEFPLTTLPLRVAWKTVQLPIAGGGYLRLLPVGIIQRGIAAINYKEQQPAVLYFHPWEIDPGQPRIRAGLKSRFRHYLNLQHTERKIRQLLRNIQFAPMNEVLSTQGFTRA